MSNIEKFDLYFAEYIGRLYKEFPLKCSFTTEAPELQNSYEWLQVPDFNIESVSLASVREQRADLVLKRDNLIYETRIRTATVEWLFEFKYFSSEKKDERLANKPVMYIGEDGEVVDDADRKSVLYHVYDGAVLTPKVLEGLHAIPDLAHDENKKTIGELFGEYAADIANETKKQGIKSIVSTVFGTVLLS